MKWIRNLIAKVDTNARIIALEEQNRSIEKAYRRLEHDSEEMWETVRKALGRVSRLKRDVDSGKLDPAKKEGQVPEQMVLSAAEQRIAIYRSVRNAVSSNPTAH